jgi:Holliday junction resolvase RusA-like endonuclease
MGREQANPHRQDCLPIVREWLLASYRRACDADCFAERKEVWCGPKTQGVHEVQEAVHDSGNLLQGGGAVITFTVLGDAKPAGSKRAFAIKRGGVPTGQIAVSDANPNSKAWKQEVAHAARQVFQGQLIDGPLRVTLKFFRPRPKGHFGSKGLNAKGRSSVAPTTKPDVLKLARGVEDACTSVIWRDDAQIVHEVITKEYGEPARCEVTIEPIGD